MILAFKKKINGKETHFVEKILACYAPDYAKLLQPKKHTIRNGYRFKQGDKLHMTTNPYKKGGEQFNRGIEHLKHVHSTQPIAIRNLFGDKAIFITSSDGEEKELSTQEIETLAINDGFDSVEDFWDFFKEGGDVEGQIIHWTDLKY